MLKKKLAVFLVLLLMPVAARGEYWAGGVRPVVCCDDRPGCQVLQTVMMGSYALFDEEDSLNLRVLSAVLPRLIAVTEEDFAHFTENFDVPPDTLRELYYVALSNCLRADILVTPMAENMDEQNARVVLNLFLASLGPEEESQRLAIRQNCTPETVLLLAEASGMPVDFVAYLMGGNRNGCR